MRAAGGNAPDCAACPYPPINSDEELKELIRIFGLCLPAVSDRGVDLASVMAVIGVAVTRSEELTVLEIMQAGFKEYMKIIRTTKGKTDG